MTDITMLAAHAGSPAATAPGASAPSRKQELGKAAGDFETILLGQWLQGAEDSFGSVPGGDEDQDAGDEQMKGFAVQALAKSFAHAGGIGIATLVEKALTKESGVGASSASPPAVHGAE